MKVEIDLNDVFAEEGETLHESIRRQIIDNMTTIVSTGIGKKVDSEVAKILNDEIRKVVTEKMPVIVNDLLTAEYMPVDRYGQYGRETTTFRKELVKAIHEQMIYKKCNYDSDKNAFSKAVDEVVKESVNSFKLAFNKQVDADYTAEVMAAATKKIQERLGLKAA